jgi:hydrogenase large subunit
MSKVVQLQIPINRVEGDLDIKVTIEDGVITDAKSIGTLYRGFENILKGRDPLDALVITPRVCGICSISHLAAAVKALEDAYGITPPAQAIRLRNLSVICENMQSDIKQVFLMFMADFASDYYKEKDFHEVAKREYEPFKGRLSKSILNATKDVLKIIAYIGGQWPHTSHMVPGGLSALADDLEVLRIRYLILKFKEWLEEEVLKTSVKEIKELKSYDELVKFVANNPDSHLSIFFNIAKECELFEIGKTGYGFLNYGSVDRPDGTFEIPRCYYDGKKTELDLDSISEDVTYSWYDAKTLNPMSGKTVPDMNKENAYSFTKAPRYAQKAVQTGPLGEELALDNPLFLDLYKRFGDSVFVREFARMLRAVRYISSMEGEIEEIIKNLKDPVYEKPKTKKNTQGIGLTHAARGALGHWIKIKNGKIENYQIISPTTWNGSPKDADDNMGAWEKALIGLKIKDIDNPMEMGHVIRSFDPCLVCTVHFIGDKEQSISLKV